MHGPANFLKFRTKPVKFPFAISHNSSKINRKKLGQKRSMKRESQFGTRQLPTIYQPINTSYPLCCTHGRVHSLSTETAHTHTHLQDARKPPPPLPPFQRRRRRHPPAIDARLLAVVGHVSTARLGSGTTEPSRARIAAGRGESRASTLHSRFG